MNRLWEAHGDRAPSGKHRSHITGVWPPVALGNAKPEASVVILIPVSDEI